MQAGSIGGARIGAVALQQYPTFHALQSPHTLELWLPTSMLNALACWGCWRTSVLPGMGLAACKSMLMRGAVLLRGSTWHSSTLSPRTSASLMAA